MQTKYVNGETLTKQQYVQTSYPMTQITSDVVDRGKLILLTQVLTTLRLSLERLTFGLASTNLDHCSQDVTYTKPTVVKPLEQQTIQHRQAWIAWNTITKGKSQIEILYMRNQCTMNLVMEPMLSGQCLKLTV